ncbi:hypothetical protein A3K86_19655 [Photobacterium jeanii]|uniref:Uncharacterized protein n=1 Tax=Photobacterium jeanii TaxID=858640 RepID=A0A178K1G8_9GAMM|nr:hypothetical protein [Photobacterium jeanii]OAN11179.1 hypothetical protein A3K86_19655 [Photobacterium jeanii]PST90698.1 hypothetical protein C9I91_08755 [Photobacterium jeanii]
MNKIKFIFLSSFLTINLLTISEVVANDLRFDVRSYTGASCSSSKRLSRIKAGVRGGAANGKRNNINRYHWTENYNNDKHLYIELEIPFSFHDNNPSPAECVRILKQEEKMRDFELEEKEYEIEMLKQQLASQELLLSQNTFVSN